MHTLKAVHLSLLRDLEWCGGVAVMAPFVEQSAYLDLCGAGLVYAEEISPGKIRYELEPNGRLMLMAARSD